MIKPNSYLLAFTLASFLSSCATENKMSNTQAIAVAKKGLVVVESDDTKGKFTVIGTTAFNNGFETIPDSDINFATYMTQRLREKGYKVTTSSSEDHPRIIKLSATYPYGGPGMRGLGFFRRSFLGMSSPTIAYCNFYGQLRDSESNSIKSLGIDFHGKGFFHDRTSVMKDADSWSDLTPSEQTTLKKELQPVMRKQADRIIKGLGL